MPIEDGVAALIIEKVRRLRAEQQEEVLRFVESLEFKQHPALERVIAQIRERAASLDLAEMEAWIEEAREEYDLQQPHRAERKNVKGLWADLDLEITEEDVDAARREMWGHFPRDLEE